MQAINNNTVRSHQSEPVRRKPPRQRCSLSLHAAAARNCATAIRETLEAMEHSTGHRMRALCESRNPSSNTSSTEEKDSIDRNVNTIGSFGQTPLHVAARFGHGEAAVALLNANADTEVGDVGGWTALHFASKAGTVDVVNVLLAHGANAHAKDVSWRTPLHMAASAGYADIVEILIQQGYANPNSADHEGRTALHCAVYAQSIATVLKLLSLQADVYSRDKYGNTAIDAAEVLDITGKSRHKRMIDVPFNNPCVKQNQLW